MAKQSTRGVLVIVPCGRSKIWDRNPNAGPTPARNAYKGPPFVVNKEFAECVGEQWVVLSAKYGFVKPDRRIPGPYNVTFKRKSSGPVTTAKLRQQIRQQKLSRFQTVIGLGGKEYRQAIKDAFEGSSAELTFPFANLPIFKMMQATKRTTKANTSMLEKSTVAQNCHALHGWLNDLAVLGFPINTGDIPRNGLYVLFEKGERAHGTNRIVRVGTHRGSNQLRSRLIQHFVNETNFEFRTFRRLVRRCFAGFG